jgi:pimeloyl-ACP methyl ester carboxylesterase
MSHLLTHRVEGPPSGAALLLLNGGMMSISAWDDLAEPLARRYRVLRCDFRGQLLTPASPPPELDGHVADVVALLDRLAVDRAHVVGTSFGGEVALLLAARHPDRVRSLVAAAVVDYPPPAMLAIGSNLVALCEHAVASGDGRPFLAAMSEIVYSPAYRSPLAAELETRYQALASLPASWFSGGAGLLAAIARMDLTAELPKVSCPALVIAAELDALMPMERTVAVARGIRGAELVVVEGSGHALVVEQKDLFRELVTAFVGRQTDNPGSVLPSP